MVLNRRVFLLLILLEVGACIAIINAVRYTEIDWKAYMEQVEGFLGGERDYSMLKGGTGPLVYPAGFLYIFSLFYLATQEGSNILTGQILFGFLLIATVSLVTLIYSRSRIVPLPVTFLFLCSKRIHSIFLLRLFNDPVAMLFMFASIYFILEKRWSSAAIFYSLALSVKMNVLLFAPGFAFVFYNGIGLSQSFYNAIIVVILQALIGYPFLNHEPIHYISRAFELSRQFFYEWTVNWRMLSEENFLSKQFSLILLVLHLCLLLGMAFTRWSQPVGGISSYLSRTKFFSADDILLILFSSNFIGIVCARSLHYQFYSWYFYTLPYLLWRTNLPVWLKIPVFFGIEWCWNVFPSTNFSSSLLLSCHFLILALLFYTGEEHLEKNKVK